MLFFADFKNKGKQGQHAIEYVVLLTLIMAGIVIAGQYVIRSWNASLQSWDDSVIDSFQDPLNEGDPVDIDPGCTPVDGGWTPWGICSGTSPNCTQSRSCTNPWPNACGAACSGPTEQACTGGACTEPCVPVDGVWSPWSICEGTDPNCTQTRTCTFPDPTCIGAPCSGPTSQGCTGGNCVVPPQCASICEQLPPYPDNCCEPGLSTVDGVCCRSPAWTRSSDGGECCADCGDPLCDLP